MKKLVIAAAVAAIAAPAMAQNVSIYGVMDVNVQSHKKSGGSSVTRQAGAGSFASSQLGFKGTEDLGGGLKAFFELRDEFDMANQADFNFGQESHVGLEGSFGKIRLGTTDITPVQTFDGGSAAGQFGNVTNNPSASYSGGTTAIVELGKDAQNAFAYTSPSFSGFQVHLGHATGHNSSTVDDQDADTNSVALTYANGPIYVGVGSSNLSGSGVKAMKHDALAASYDFKVAKVGVSYAVFESSVTTDSKDTKVTIVSASVPLSGALTLRAGYMMGKIDGETSNEAKGFVVGGTYSLSKRTTAYAHYTKVTNESDGAFGWAGTTAPTVRGQDPTAIGVGISHSF